VKNIAYWYCLYARNIIDREICKTLPERCTGKAFITGEVKQTSCGYCNGRVEKAIEYFMEVVGVEPENSSAVQYFNC